MEVTFELWIDALVAEVKKTFTLTGSVIWSIRKYPMMYREYYDDGLTPGQALEKEWLS
ncbi:hypothetical protein D3C78_1191820 [compost metagenome]